MKKLWKIIKVLVWTFVAVFVISLAIVVGVASSHRPVGKADAIIVLGAAINTPAAYNRALEGLRLYEAGDAKVLVLSGGQDYAGAQTEAVYMENAILSEVAKSSSGTLSASSDSASPPEGENNKVLRAMPPMVLDPDSRSTYDNIENSKKLLPQAHSVIIVSDSFHLARGVLMAKAAGFGPVYWSSPQPTYYKLGELAYYYLREAFGLIDYLPKFFTAR